MSNLRLGPCDVASVLFDVEVFFLGLLVGVFLFFGLWINVGLFIDTDLVFLLFAGVDADFGGFPRVFLTFTIFV